MVQGDYDEALALWRTSTMARYSPVSPINIERINSRVELMGSLAERLSSVDITPLRNWYGPM